MAKQGNSTRQALTIQTQVVFVIGLILLLVLAIATYSYFTLQNYQRSVNTTLSDASKVEELSASIQREFLLARQSESAFLSAWKLSGYDEQLKGYIAGNTNHIAQARAQLSQLEFMVSKTSNPEIQAIGEKIHLLRPLLDEYESAFNATVELVQKRTEPGGLDSTIALENKRLTEGLAALPDNQFLQTAYKMQVAQQNYLSTHRQEFIDTFKIQNDKLLNLVNTSNPSELETSALSIPEIKNLVDDQYKFFSDVIHLEQDIDINSAIFQDSSVQINQAISEINEKSISDAARIRSNMTVLGQQASLTIMIAAATALAVGVAAGIIHTINLVSPIRRLTRAATEIGSGKLEERVAVRGPREINQLANDFNIMADRLLQTLTGLEERVEERTQALARRSTQLQVSAEVARDAASIRDLDVLLSQTVNLIRDRFGFYHAGIFLVDPRREYAILRAATGDAGRSMLDQKHRLKVGEVGIVGAVCSTGEPRISLDVGDDAIHFRNPLLPETRSEMALPLRSGRQVIGAIDVQSTQQSAFDEQDVAVLQSMADQLAVAIENARLFEESQESLLQLQSVYGNYSKQAWDTLSNSRQMFGYVYETGEVKPITTQEASDAPVSLPLAVRGQVIGSLDIWPGDQPLTSAERTMLKSVSDRISQAMESARLYEDAQNRASREKSLSQLTALFTQSLSFDTILKTAVQELGKLPNVSEASIQFEMPKQEEH